MTDKINPKHYKSHPAGVECITVTEHASFNVGNAIKYAWRSEWPGGRISTEKLVENLEKARWYLGREIERQKSGHRTTRGRKAKS